MKLKKWHYLSGLVLTLFIAVHLINHFFAWWGPEAHIRVNNSVRVIYRHPVVEAVLLACVITQIISGIALFRRSKKMPFTTFTRLHLYTGLYLAAFLLLHVSAVMAGRHVLGLDTNIYFGVAGLNTFPFNLFFVPYYVLAVVSVFGHMAAVHHLKMKHAVMTISPRQQSITILVGGICLALVLLFGLTNGFQGIAIPETYNVLIGQ